MGAGQHEMYVNRLGNLSLLWQEYNRNAVNKDFKSKKEIYRKTEIPMTQALVEYDSWGSEMLEERQKKLAVVALDIWRKVV